MTIRKYAIGTNMSGYLPDSEAYEVHGKAQALDALKSEIVLTIESFDGFDPLHCDGFTHEWVDWAIDRAKKQMAQHDQAHIWVKERVHWVMPI
jgi:hypothetical protein